MMRSEISKSVREEGFVRAMFCDQSELLLARSDIPMFVRRIRYREQQSDHREGSNLIASESSIHIDYHSEKSGCISAKTFGRVIIFCCEQRREQDHKHLSTREAAFMNVRQHRFAFGMRASFSRFVLSRSIDIVFVCIIDELHCLPQGEFLIYQVVKSFSLGFLAYPV